MQIQWIIEPIDIERTKSFVDSYLDDPFVRLRIRRNLSDHKQTITKEIFWQVMVSCLLTTRQRSGPSSPVKDFLDIRPFPLSYDLCASEQDLGGFVRDVLRRSRGIRRYNRIADEAKTNLRVLELGLWHKTLDVCNGLRVNSTTFSERQAAYYIDDTFKGFGPKQSRNLLQWLGLTRYEIPIDRRITKWLNRFGFPFKLTASSLSDRHYYDLASDGIQHLCHETGVYPCVLDAAIFTSFDEGSWTEENLQPEDIFGT